MAGKKFDIGGAVKREIHEPKVITAADGGTAKVKPPKPDIDRITIYVPKAQTLALAELALEMKRRNEWRDRSALIAEAIEDFLEKHGKGTEKRQNDK
jgi:ribosomal protein S16